MSRVIGIRKDGETKYYRLARKKVNVPSYGVMTADELVSKPVAVEALLKLKSPVFEEVSEKEYLDHFVPRDDKAEAAAKAKAVKAEAEAKVKESAGKSKKS